MNNLDLIKSNLDNSEVQKWLNSGKFKRYASDITKMPERVACQLVHLVGLDITPEQEAYQRCKEILKSIKYLRHLDAEWGDSMSPQDVADATFGNDASFDDDIAELRAEFKGLRPLANKWLPI